MTEAFESDVAVAALDLGDAKVETRQVSPEGVHPDYTWVHGIKVD